jgi:hypothetical protein
VSGQSHFTKFSFCKLLSCADSFREDLTSRGLEENIYRVLYFSPREEKISASADVVS